MTIAIIAVGLGLVIGNYVYQAFGAQEYIVAAERSFFQVTALFAAWLTISLRQAVS